MPTNNLIRLADIRFRCSKCAGDEFLVEDETNEPVVVCQSCGSKFDALGKVCEAILCAATEL